VLKNGTTFSSKSQYKDIFILYGGFDA